MNAWPVYINRPAAGVVGGCIVRGLLTNGTWRDVFELGAFAIAAMIPVVWLLIPESVAFLERKRPASALAAINKTQSGFRHASIGALPRVDQGEARRSIMYIFPPKLLAATLTITLAYFAHITSFYFIIKWVPKRVVDMGFEPSAAAGVLMWTNVGAPRAERCSG
jgi:hypothetical protein